MCAIMPIFLIRDTLELVLADTFLRGEMEKFLLRTRSKRVKTGTEINDCVLFEQCRSQIFESLIMPVSGEVSAIRFR